MNKSTRRSTRIQKGSKKDNDQPEKKVDKICDELIEPYYDKNNYADIPTMLEKDSSLYMQKINKKKESLKAREYTII